MSLTRSATTILFVLTIILHTGCNDTAPSKPPAWKDEGVLVYRIGTDTIGYQYFRMDDDSIRMRSIYFPGGFIFTETTGELMKDGSIKNLHSIRMINDSTGDLVLSGQARINSGGGVTSVDMTGPDAQEQIFPGTAFAVSNAGPATSYLVPFWGRYAKEKDSVISTHYAFNNSRPFWLLKITDNLVYAGSDLLGKLRLRVDSMNRLLSVDGTESPLHIRGEVNRAIDFDSLFKILHSTPEYQSVPPLSPVSKNLYHFADLDVALNYSRPSKRGRKIFGGIVPYERPWRMGANRATEISFSEPVYIGQRRIEPGTYSLFAMMAPNAGMLLINDHPGIWGTDHEFQWDAFRVPFTIGRLDEPREQLQLQVYPVGEGMYELSMEWDQLRATVIFGRMPFDSDADD